MMENEAKALKEVEQIIEQKDFLIRQLKDEIQSLKKATQDGYNEGLSEGMGKTWLLARKIVRGDWKKTDEIKTVEDWFELFTVKDAMKVMDDLKPHWKKDVVRMSLVCSECGYASLVRHKFCPACGAMME